MNVTRAQIRQLQDFLSGAGRSDGGEAHATGSADAAPKYHIGSVWYGDWHKETRFGHAEKPNHNAVIRRRDSVNVFFTLAPITSQATFGAVPLPRGLIPGGMLCTSYILTCIHLRASRDTLDRNFEFKCLLPSQYVEVMQRQSKVKASNEH